MIELLVIADDFTGAMDTGVQFSKFGISTLVVLENGLPGCFGEFDEDVEVLVVDTESRHIEAEKAYRAVRRVTELAVKNGIHYIYKKVDSTMRGNVGSELEAVRDGSGFEDTPLLFIPAFPAQGRFTRNGIQYIGEVPVGMTEFAEDPFTPVEESSIPVIISRQSEIPTMLAGPEDIEQIFREGRGMAAIIDAQTDEELGRIAKQIRRQGKEQLLLAGNAGFAAKLPQIIRFHVEELGGDRGTDELLVVCGSLNKASFEQLYQAEQAGIPSVTLTKEQKKTPGYFETVCGARDMREWERVLREAGSLIIKLSNETELPDIRKEEREENREHLRIAGNVGHMVAKLLRETKLEAIAVFGGDTLYGIVSGMDGFRIKPQKEILPGVVQSELDFEGRRLLAVTKAGGFGEKDTLLKIFRHYRLKEGNHGCGADTEDWGRGINWA
ncbi:four-carbon acid sugar kinase family protein [Lacrimispora sp. NSJ-141]|uniref:Four-carbon acid sugar kinase family protein n=1 Tax=Lientehia hominis TaxID=2897778 RepID=A0AAP2RJV9_9FIRM|nr:four-carbon acid sugar kinase family protein [Lientehia hominis]MCD2492981.1 four-carbon acid sugar kinase family protein [Lientehia hominis]